MVAQMRPATMVMDLAVRSRLTTTTVIHGLTQRYAGHMPRHRSRMNTLHVRRTSMSEAKVISALKKLYRYVKRFIGAVGMVDLQIEVED